ncbi:MAG: hypothetical protein JJU46_14175 [Balneolaceae bacterium]|nr:hypothetical protein [Balneolaceae bacterium]MCH8549802.1 hypothetical protein [Balneolaceae bacterium]
MPLQNRVDPWGNLNAVEARGNWMGNRGILHNEEKEIVAPWRHKSWVTCKLEFNERKRKVFGPNSYSELFFLDEATALAAGHRPCGTCRRKRYNDFKRAWVSANGNGNDSISISDIDKQLHSERAIPNGGKVTFQSSFSEIPNGAFIEVDDAALLIWKGQLYQWSPFGYNQVDQRISLDSEVVVLTPFSIFQMMQSGFTPQVEIS